MVNKRCCCTSALVTVGLVLIIVGVVFIPVSKNLIHNEITEQIDLHNKDTFDNWQTNPTPIYFQIWIWNVTNPDEIKKGEKPSIEQHGPYTYRESRKKIAIAFHDNNNTVTYRENQYFHFDKEKSPGLLESDVYTTVNIPMMFLSNVVRKEPAVLRMLVEAALEREKEQLFVQLSVKQILWGYEDQLVNKTLSLIEKFVSLNVSSNFGLFSTSNNSNDGLYNIGSGRGDVAQFGKIKEWNSMKTLPFWSTSQCNMLNGTDGTIFHPFIKKSDLLYIFSSDLCRSIYVSYTEESQQKGIDTYRFVAPPSVFLNYSANPANKGFCPVATDNTTCLASGLLDIENCKYGAPIVLSQPHFLSADPSVINSVIGVHPDPNQHQTVLDIEPNTGAAFSASKKLQLNIQLQPIGKIKQLEKVPRVVLPVIWLNESSLITDALADKFKSALQKPEQAIHIGIWVAIALGIAFVVCTASYLLVRKIMNKNKPYQYGHLEPTET